VIGRTTDESSPAWPRPVRAAAGAPNVLVIVLDDTGVGQLGCYGSPIATPNLDTLAAGGLLYTSMHTTALCSPSRSCIITGCNHHANATAAGAHSPARIGYFRRAPRRRSYHYRWRANRQRLAQLTIRISSTDQVNPVPYNLRARHNRRGERRP